MKRLNKIALICFIAVMLFSCKKNGWQPKIIINNIEWSVELARTDEEQKLGLMYRDKLDKRCGMLFIGEYEEHKSFWMKNTKIPLSLAYIKSDGTISQIENLIPYDENSIRSKEAVQYVLEVNMGEFEKYEIKVGDKVYFKIKERLK